MIYKILKMSFILFFLFFSQTAYTHDYYLGKLTIDHPYMVAPMPGSKMSSGYLKIINKGAKSDYLMGAESLFSQNIEIHEMIMANNVMKMRKLPNGLEIPGGKETNLEPGGYHIMFKNLNKKLMIGGKEKVLLIFRDTGKIIVTFEIKKMGHKVSDH